ncbi:MAG: hypothetical protein HOF38_02340 [Elusimicrobiaceae bacterium]|jgi:acetyl-CoA carboxylase biotin carboxyl carrier protein|nr:hypothetical protein [Elusimicrobiaceae bacterium]MBT3954984.1 hypothetical protein [Elusimicrobiaceae bacterium]MBT4008124.1 hypothetical protein [Elusimicrobiaceae bacterium]MBT4402680.1 hypothetical protein [Elusimicrobiaceae bacterium]MBT4440036.1 hypothetical protein [Elusimicrobiaceae bacterium]
MKQLKEISDWVKQTDLVEVFYKNKKDHIKIKTAEAPVEGAHIQCSYKEILSPALGIYHASQKGKNLNLKEGKVVKKGEVLGIVEQGKTNKEIKCPVEGKLKKIMIEDGDAVEYNQPLFFVEEAS